MQWIRQKYWIPQLRDELKQHTRRCAQYARNNPPTQEQLMANLPPTLWRLDKIFEILRDKECTDKNRKLGVVTMFVGCTEIIWGLWTGDAPF